MAQRSECMDMSSPTPPDSFAADERRQRLTSALAETLPALVDRQGALLAVKDVASGRYLHVNAAMATLIGRAPNEVIGRTDIELLDAPIVTALRAAEQTALAQPQPLTSEHRFDMRGERHDYSVLRLVTEGADGSRQLCAVWTDQRQMRQKEAQMRAALEQLEQQQRANEQLRQEMQDHTLRDGATGLYHRAHFEDQLRREVDLSTREHREFALVWVAIDPFSPAVAARGEPAKMRILEALGRLLRSNTRAMDASCRLDESRFAVLLSGVGLATAHARMEGLRRQCVAQIVVLDGEDLSFSVSMGVASFPHTAYSQEELVQACESALAEAQRRGGNHVTLASIRFEPA
jgi:diguanylate cyclase (GGDEF)-like protein